MTPRIDDETPTGSLATALLRITLGVIVLATWRDNLGKGLYEGGNFKGLLEWLAKSAEDGGNGGSLGFFHSIMESVVIPNAGLVGGVQLVIELAFGIGLLLGLFTRLSSLLAAGFFVSLLLAYFGGQEWIWTYVLLTAATLTVFLGYGGRKYGVDQALSGKKSLPGDLLW